MIRNKNGGECVVIIAWDADRTLDYKSYKGSLKAAIAEIMHEDTGYGQTPGVYSIAEVYNLNDDYSPKDLLYTWTPADGGSIVEQQTESVVNQEHHNYVEVLDQEQARKVISWMRHLEYLIESGAPKFEIVLGAEWILSAAK